MTPTPRLSFNLLCIPFQTLEPVAGHHFKSQRTLHNGPYNGHLLGFMALTDNNILLDKDIMLCRQTISVKHNNSLTKKLHVFMVHKLWCLTVKVHKLYDKIVTPRE